jgi:micrococcal nuclease
MPNVLVAAIIGVIAFSATYLIFSQAGLLSATLSTTANAVKIFATNLQDKMQNATQNLQQNLSETTKTTTTTSTAAQTNTQTTSETNQQTTPETASATTTTTTPAETTSTTTEETSDENSDETLEETLCMGHALCVNDTVTNVIEGNVIETQNHGLIKLALVKTPEQGQDGYQEAKDFTTEICMNKTALIDQDSGQTVDSSGRKIAVVYCDGWNMNEELYYGGYAEIDAQQCGNSKFANEQWAIDGGCQ